jgi:hypothetical protein
MVASMAVIGLVDVGSVLVCPKNVRIFFDLM